MVLPGDDDEVSLGVHMERQMGCMAGFLQIFDRHQMLAGRRALYPAKRLPSSASSAFSCTTSPSERSDSSASSSPKGAPSPLLPKPQLPPEGPARRSQALPVFDFKEGQRSSWKFREAPRLSLDSRVDGRVKGYPREIRTVAAPSVDSFPLENKEKQPRPPSVVARLMGLEALPGGNTTGGDGRAELRRSASESRVSKDLLHCQFVDSRFFPPPSSQGSLISEDNHREVRQSIVGDPKTEPRPGGISLPACPPHPPPAFGAVQRKSFFDVQDYFISELPKRAACGSLYGDSEKRRLRGRDIDEPAKDIETLKQILEVIQLRGLLHPSQRQRSGPEVLLPLNARNIVYDWSPTPSNCYESPIVVMQPARSPSPRSPPPPLYYRPNASPPPPRRSSLPTLELTSRLPRRNPADIGNGRSSSKTNNENRVRGAGVADPSTNGCPPARRRPASPPQPASLRKPSADRRTFSNTPKAGSPRKAGSDPASRSSRNNGRPASSERLPPGSEEDFIGSDNTPRASPQFDFERVKSEYRDGRILLERCDKLLHSIAEMTSKASADEEQANAAEQQPSPVSVLDVAASFDGDYAVASSSPPRAERYIDFKTNFGGTSEDGDREMPDGVSEVDDGDYLYVSEILRSSDSRRSVHDMVFPELQPPNPDGDDATDFKALPLHRVLVFDAVSEIVEQRTQVSSWESFTKSRSAVAGRKAKPQPAEVWAELRRLQEHTPADDLCDLICGVLRKDMATTTSERAWSSRSVEMSDAVLDIERLLFKDLVADTIRQLAAVFEGWRQCRASCAPPQPRTVGRGGAAPPRRRLTF